MELRKSGTHSPSREGQKPTAEYPSSPQTVLIAEDDQLLARSLAADLADLGYRVIGPIADGQAAVELARKEQPDLALLDIKMPGMDGLAVGEILQSELNIPVIILSGHSDPSYLQAAGRLPVFGYLLKPVSMSSLSAVITVAWGRFLEYSRLREEVADLKTKLENRKVIEKAKGLLMKNKGIAEEEAMRLLQKQARDARKPMVDIAQAIIQEEAGVKKPE